MTPPHNLLLALLPSGSAAGLAAALAARGTAVPGLYGTPEATAEFAAAWREVAGIGVAESSERRLYVLEKLRPPDPLPAGAARAAGSADLDVVARWFADFEAEAHGGPAREDPDLGRARQRERVETGHVWLWEDPAGTVVSMAGRQPTVAGVARVGPVYTPPPERRRGYGAAVTAACTTAALAGGAEHVVLFTDLANPTSNAIYQQIGFRPRSDRREVTFAS
jgi:RimJ/RimL family protein N-acetyltransferase